MERELRGHARKKLGPAVAPREVIFRQSLPKTRSGKIMRRLLRDVAEHRTLGDVTTLADPTVMGIIGQGLAGSLLAWRLLLRGERVLVVDNGYCSASSTVAAGLINPVTGKKELNLMGEEQEIPFQLAASGRATPNDANSLQVTRGGVATGLVAIPNRYMHSAVETVSLDDLDHAADLLAALAMGLQGDEDFTPS